MALECLQKVGAQQAGEYAEASPVETFGEAAYGLQRFQGSLGVFIAQHPRARQCRNGRQLCTGTVLAAMGLYQFIQRRQQFGGAATVALDQQDPDLLAQQVGHRADLPQAT
ncbi:hypothetical protein D3C76_991070 [compost metagenome]